MKWICVHKKQSESLGKYSQMQFICKLIKWKKQYNLIFNIFFYKDVIKVFLFYRLLINT